MWNYVLVAGLTTIDASFSCWLSDFHLCYFSSTVQNLSKAKSNTDSLGQIEVDLLNPSELGIVS
jgi:hypothetical protein